MSEVRRRFPVGLTIASAVSLAILLSLGTWQVQRLHWKTELLARIERVKAAPVQPIGIILAQAAKGEDVDYSRVEATCSPNGGAPSKVYLYGVVDGRTVWRNLAPCEIDGQIVVVDRGYAPPSDGMSPPRTAPALPVTVTGVLRKPEQLGGIRAAVTHAQNNDIGWQTRQGAMAAAAEGAGAGAGKPVSEFVLVAESESPKADGLTPAPLPTDIPNRHLEYALTWYGLAAALVGVYVALLRRRLKSA